MLEMASLANGYDMERLAADQANGCQPQRLVGEAQGERTGGGGGVKKSRNEGTTHDVIDNKGPVFGEPAILMKINELT